MQFQTQIIAILTVDSRVSITSWASHHTAEQAVAMPEIMQINSQAEPAVSPSPFRVQAGLQ